MQNSWKTLSLGHNNQKLSIAKKKEPTLLLKKDRSLIKMVAQLYTVIC